jgi:hypothetical protein
MTDRSGPNLGRALSAARRQISSQFRVGPMNLPRAVKFRVSFPNLAGTTGSTDDGIGLLSLTPGKRKSRKCLKINIILQLTARSGKYVVHAKRGLNERAPHAG